VWYVGDHPRDVEAAHAARGQLPTLRVAGLRGGHAPEAQLVQAGADATTAQEWRHIAMLNQGEYFQVEQSGSALAVTSPFDEKIAALSRELDATRLFYGDADKQREMAGKSAATDKLNAVATVGSRVKRAMFNTSVAGEKNLLGDSELVDAVANGRVDLATLAPEALPAPLRQMSKDEQVKVVKEKADARARLNAEIQDLGKQRSQFIVADLKTRAGSADSLDDKIYNTVKAQAAKKGLKYEGAAAH